MKQTMNFLFTTWEGGGNVTPALEVVRKLVAHGHRVRVLAEECNRPESEAAGATFVPWRSAPSRKSRSRECQPYKDWAAPTPQEGLLHVFKEVWCGPALAYAQDTINELRREPADLVVTSETLFGVMAGCEKLGQKFVTLAPNLSLAPLPGVPPMGPGQPPARTEQEKAMHAEILKGTLALFDAGLPAVNAAREALGLKPLGHLLDQLQSAEAEL